MESAFTYKCPCCDAGLKYDGALSKFVCDFCLSKFTKEELDKTDSHEKAKKAEEENELFAGIISEYNCPSCGAKVILDRSTAADFCVYCHNPIVLTDKVSGMLKPDAIIPFNFGKEDAKEAFSRYIKKHAFLPKDCFRSIKDENVNGVYYPFWVTDSDTDSSYEAIGEKIRHWRSGDYEYTEKRKYRIFRKGRIHFEDITVAAISTEDKAALEGILPYPTDRYEKFDMPYLSGFVAKKRDVTREEATPTVRSRMINYSTTLLARTARGYDRTYDVESNMDIKRSSWTYALAPVWLFSYKGKKDRIYSFSMNGFTGKIYGSLPISFKKISLLFALIFAGVFALIVSIGLLSMKGGMI